MNAADQAIADYDKAVFQFPITANLTVLAFYAADECEKLAKDRSFPLWARKDYADKASFFQSQMI